MKTIRSNTLLTFLILLAGLSLTYGQVSFKGKITYSIDYRFYNESSSNFRLMDITGHDLIVYYTDGKILNFYPGGQMDFFYYSNNEKRSYQKFRNSDTIYYVNTDVKGYDIRDYEIIENTAILFNKACNSLVLYFETGPYLTWEETFSPEIYYDPGNVNHYAIYNYNFVYSKTKSIPLKTVVQNKNERIEYLATDIYKGDDKAMFGTIEEMIRKGILLEIN